MKFYNKFALSYLEIIVKSQLSSWIAVFEMALFAGPKSLQDLREMTVWMAEITVGLYQSH